jgi:CheY-like chemotaxis protein
MRILYVEDNQANLFLIQRVARMGGHQVITYTDGESALKNFTTDDPHLILMDLQLAGELTGLDVVRALRSRGSKTPVVAVTAYAMVGDRERCMEAGCDGYLSKPLPVTELVEIIRKYEARTSLPQAAPEAVAAPAQAAVEQPPTPATPPVPAASTAPAAPAASTVPAAPEPVSPVVPAASNTPVSPPVAADSPAPTAAPAAAAEPAASSLSLADAKPAPTAPDSVVPPVKEEVKVDVKKGGDDMQPAVPMPSTATDKQEQSTVSVVDKSSGR